jgi:catechol 2,3-dioxygenase-like lactoylglutathione lyase family enzyme
LNALRLIGFGAPASVVSFGAHPELLAGRDELLVELEAAPVHPSDLHLIRGFYGVHPDLPAPLGADPEQTKHQRSIGTVGRCAAGTADWADAQLTAPTPRPRATARAWATARSASPLGPNDLRQAIKELAVFDHVTLRVADLPMASSAFKAVLDQLEIEQTSSTPNFSVWGNFAITQTDQEHRISRRVHVAFIAPTPAHVDRFWRAAADAGFTGDGAAGPRFEQGDLYYAAFLKDGAGNSFVAVHHDGDRPGGNIDHVVIHATDVEASTAFYSTIGAGAGLTVRRETGERAAFSVGASGGSLLLIAGEPTRNVHLAFSGDDDDIHRFHADAIAAGYRSNGEPGERSRYHDGYYAAYVLDPDDNNIEVVNHHRSREDA